MKLHPPSFWNTPTSSKAAKWLSPLSSITHYISYRRQNCPAPKVPVPVFCCGNISVGGTGKTPLAIDIAKRLQERGKNPHFLTRGYGGRKNGSQRISLQYHTALDVGDESLILANTAPTWRGSNRFLSAQQAIQNGADCLIMDDGLQNRSLHKDFSFLVIDGTIGFGNGKLIPAGPLREPLKHIKEQVQAVTIIGPDLHNTTSLFPASTPVLQARFMPSLDIRTLTTKQLIAFAGIGRPEKFFSMLRELGLCLSRCLSFPDHHRYTDENLQQLIALAQAPGTCLVTTRKDAVKLPSSFLRHVHVIDINLLWTEPQYLDSLLDSFLEKL